MPDPDIATIAIEQLPPDIAQEFQEYNERYRNAWRGPWKALRDTRLQLAKALDCYRYLFNEWKQFYSAIDDRLKAAFKDRATRAIEGMTAGTVASRIVDLDKRYKVLCQASTAHDAHDQAGRILLALETTREEVAELALAYTKAVSDLAAAESCAERYEELSRIVGEPRSLQVFLHDEFPLTWASLSDGRPLVQITTEVLRQLKEGKSVQ